MMPILELQVSSLCCSVLPLVYVVIRFVLFAVCCPLSVVCIVCAVDSLNGGLFEIGGRWSLVVTVDLRRFEC